MFIRRELGGTGTGCLFQFTYCGAVYCRNTCMLIPKYVIPELSPFYFLRSIGGYHFSSSKYKHFTCTCPRGGTVPVFLRKLMATCDFQGAGVLNPPPPSGSTHEDVHKSFASNITHIQNPCYLLSLLYGLCDQVRFSYID